MKFIKLLLLLLVFTLAKNTYAQQNDHLNLSPQYPEAGKTIAITYDAAGTSLSGKSVVTAKIYYIDNKNFPVDTLNLTANGTVWSGNITVLDSAKAFVVKMVSDTSVDNNNGKGYIYLVYNDGKPIPGAYAANASIYQFYSTLGINSNKDAITADSQKEYELYPESGKAYKITYYSLLARSHNAANLVIVNKVIDSLLGTANEKDMLSAIRLYQASGKNAKSDSLIAIGKAKYPGGDIARYNQENSYFEAKTLAQKDSVYQLYSKNPLAVSVITNYMVTQLTTGYLKAANFNQYNKYKSLMKDTTVLAASFNDIAYNWAQAGQYLPQSEILSKESLDMLTAQINHPASKMFRTADEIKAADMQSYDYYADTYSLILYKEGKFADALKVQTPVWERNKLDPDIGEHYALILMATNDDAGATNIIETIIKAGKGTDALNADLKKCYIQKNGSDKGFVPYMATLDSLAKQQAVANLINIPAPGFTLKDLDGKPVSLASLKGKTVIVDFWATWCGPCKASMPGMQMAVNKYKDDPNVKFLFVDTWENGDDYVPGVKKFISDNKYPFHVLLDDKDADGKQGKIVEAYKVEGIPTKFIIDKNGNIRFKYVGYDGTPEALVTEVSNVIEMVR